MVDTDSQLDAEYARPPVKGRTRLGMIRRLGLFVLLGIMIVAIMYDYQIARPSVDAAYDQITVESRFVNGQSGKTFSNEDLRTLLGKMPSEEFVDGDELVEVFSYTGGIPGSPHRLYAVFKPNGKQKLFFRHAKFAYESRGDVSPIPDVKTLEYSDEELAEFAASLNRETEQILKSEYGTVIKMFERLDKNQDKQLTPDEVPLDLIEVAGDMDVDQSNSLSIDEIEARFTLLKETMPIEPSADEAIE